MTILQTALWQRNFWQNRYFFHGRSARAWRMFMYYHDKAIRLMAQERELAWQPH